MLLATVLSALTLTEPVRDPFACDLTPSVGQGTSDEGDIETLTSLGFSCRYKLVQLGSFHLSPIVGLDKQLWTVRTSGQGEKNLSTYETQDLYVGLRLDRRMSERTEFFYSFAAGQGRGSLETTHSTQTTSINGNFSDLTQTHLAHTLGANYRLTEKLALSLAYQRQEASQKWSASGQDLFIQSVSDANTLSLVDGQATNLASTKLRNSNNHTAHAIQVGLSLAFGD